MSKTRKIALVISLAGFAVTANTLPSLVTWFSDSLSIPSKWFGAVFFVQYGGFTLCSIGIGKLQKRKDLPLVGILIFALLLASIGIMLIGTIGSFFALALLMMMVGGAGGSVESIGTALLSESDEQGRMIYTSQFLFAVGAFVAPLIVGVFMKLGSTVPRIGAIIGGFAAMVGVTVMILVLMGKEEKRSTANPDAMTTNMKGAYHGATFRWMFIAIMAYVVMESVIGSWIPTFLEKAYRFSPSDSSLMLTSFWIGLSVSRFFYIYFKKKSTSVPLDVHTLLILVSLVLFAVVGRHATIVSMALLMWLIGLGCGPVWPLLIEHCATRFEDMHLVMYLVGAGSIGAIVGPAITSALFGMLSLQSLPYILIAYTLVMALAMVQVTRRRTTVEAVGA